MTTPSSIQRLLRQPRAARTLRDSWQMCLRADRRGVLVVASGTFVMSILLGVQVLLARSAVQAFLDLSEGRSNLAATFPAIGALVLVTVVAGALAAGGAQRQRLLAHALSTLVWNRIFDVTTRVGLASYDDQDFHDHLDRVRADALNRPLQLVRGLMTVAGGVIASVSVALGVLAMAPLLVPPLVLGVVPVLLLQRRGGRAEYQFAREATPVARASFYLIELLTLRAHAKDVRSFGLSRELRRRFEETSDKYGSKLGRVVRHRARLSLGSTAVTGVIGVADLMVLLVLVERGSVDAAQAAAAAIAIALLGTRLTGLASGLARMSESLLFMDDYAAFLQREVGAEVTSDVSSSFAGVHLRDVSFSYPGGTVPAVDHVALSIAPGAVVALVGENGSGKTTLSKLVVGLYSPTAGSVLDEAGADLSTVQLICQATCLFQDFGRFELTARENIALGRPDHDATEDEVRAAARRAGADEFIGSLPRGYDTVLSARFGGIDLSGGQWQRIALARAIFRDAPLLVLDEPTAALDPEAEAALVTELRSILRGASALVVSHRFSTVRAADQIHVLHSGRIVESGTHEELMALEGRYAHLYRLQADAFAA